MKIESICDRCLCIKGLKHNRNDSKLWFKKTDLFKSECEAKATFYIFVFIICTSKNIDKTVDQFKLSDMNFHYYKMTFFFLQGNNINF